MKDINCSQEILMSHFGKAVTFYFLFYEKMNTIHNLSYFINVLLMSETDLQGILLMLWKEQEEYRQLSIIIPPFLCGHMNGNHDLLGITI